MAALPDSIPLEDANGPRPSLNVVSPTNFGLDQASQELGQAEIQNRRAQGLAIRAQAATDLKSVAPQLRQLEAANTIGLQGDAAATNAGNVRGFTEAQTKKATDRIPQFEQAGWTPGQLNEYRNAANNQVGGVANAAAQHEATLLAQPIAEATQTAQNTLVAGATTKFVTSYGQDSHDIIRDHSPTDPTPLPPKLMAAFDQRKAEAVASVDPWLQPKVASIIEAQRPKELIDAHNTAVDQADNYALQGVKDHVGTLLAGVAAAPGTFQNAKDVALPAILAGTPKGVAFGVQQDAETSLVTARLMGMAQQGHAGAALQELQSGQYDSLLHGEGTKERLQTELQNQIKGYEPKTWQQIVAADHAMDSVNAEVHARLNGETTGLDLGTLDGVLSQGDVAKAHILVDAADRTRLAEGDIRDMTNEQLYAKSAEPDPKADDPDYTNKLAMLQISRKAAAEELAARKTDPAGSLYMDSKKGPPTKGVGATSQAIQTGAALRQGLQTWQSSAGQAQQAAGRSLSIMVLGQEAQQGIAEGDRAIIPKSTAQGLVAGIQQAPVDKKLDYYKSLGAMVGSLPSQLRLADGSTTSPQQIFVRQLRQAGLSQQDIAAMVDFGGDAAKLGRYVQAVQNPRVDPNTHNPAERAQVDQIRAQVTTALKPFLDAAAPLPGSNDLYQGRVNRSVVEVRSLLADNPGMGLNDAVKQVAHDTLGDYRYVNGIRIPNQIADSMDFAWGDKQHPGAGIYNGGQLIQQGMGRALAALTQGPNPPIARIPGEPAVATAARAVQAARWVNMPDDSGVMLVTSHAGQPAEQVRDQYGRGVQFHWGQLQNFARNQTDPDYHTAPKTALGPNGEPVKAATGGQTFGALMDAIVNEGEHGHTGDLSPKGAMGKYQLMPDTVKTFAAAAGVPIDMHRAQYDDDYGQRIAAQAMGAYLRKYQTVPGPGAWTLATAAYNAGPGNVDNWIRQYGDPRTGAISVKDWGARIPFKETHDYVGRVIPGAVRRLAAMGN